MTFKIEKSVPMPEPKRRKSPYPFEQLEIGDSFMVPMERDKSPAGLYDAVKKARERLKISLTTARVDGGVRVWRIAPSPQDTIGAAPND